MRAEPLGRASESSVCWGTQCLSLTELSQMLLCLEVTALGGSSCFAAGLGAGTGAPGFMDVSLWALALDLRFLAQWQGRERIFPATPVLTSGQEEIEVMADAQPLSELVCLPLPSLGWLSPWQQVMRGRLLY